METGLTIREMSVADRAVWAGMYAQLFPDASPDACLTEIDRILAAPDRTGFIAEAAGQPLGFAELSIRDFANGCETQPVPFLEGIWACGTARRQGVASALLHHLEAFARASGHTELGSDVLQGNGDGVGFHLDRGFQETERVIYYRKPL